MVAKTWTPERDAFLRTHYNRPGGLTATEIAAQFEITRHAVIGRANRLGLCKSAEDAALTRRREAERSRQRRAADRPPLVVLTSEQIETVRDARMKGQGPTQIAKATGIDVNRINRALAGLRANGIQFPPLGANMPRAAKAADRKPRSSQFPDGHPAWEPLPNREPALLMDRSGCRWPVGSETGAGQLYCDAPAEGSYCACHHALAYRPATKWEKRVGRTVLRQAGFERRVA